MFINKINIHFILYKNKMIKLNEKGVFVFQLYCIKSREGAALIESSSILIIKSVQVVVGDKRREHRSPLGPTKIPGPLQGEEGN